MQTIDEAVYDALGLLAPYDIDIPKIRIGPDEDGGYILADTFDASQQIVLSYGIANEYRFDREMAERGHQVFMFDHTIDGISDSHPNMHFFKEGIAGDWAPGVESGFSDVSNPVKNVFRLSDHLQRHNISTSRMILKIDVESHEWGALAGLDAETLCKFDQIVMELHSFESLERNEMYRKVFVKALRQLNEHFTLFHIHPNNADGPDTYHYVSGMAVSCLLEVSFIRTSLVNRKASTTVYPTDVDHPNFGARDRLMWMYPFIPEQIDSASFLQSLKCANRRTGNHLV